MFHIKKNLWKKRKEVGESRFKPRVPTLNRTGRRQICRARAWEPTQPVSETRFCLVQMLRDSSQWPGSLGLPHLRKWDRRAAPCLPQELNETGVAGLLAQCPEPCVLQDGSHVTTHALGHGRAAGGTISHRCLQLLGTCPRGHGRLCGVFTASERGQARRAGAGMSANILHSRWWEILWAHGRLTGAVFRELKSFTQASQEIYRLIGCPSPFLRP